MEMTKEDIDLLSAANAKKRELVNLIERMMNFYDDRTDALYFRARRLKYITIAVLLIAVGIMAVFLPVSTRGGAWNLIGFAALIVMALAAFFALTYQKCSDGAEHCERRLHAMIAFGEKLLGESETLDTAAHYLSLNQTRVMHFGFEYMDAQMKYGADYDPHAETPVGDANQMHASISELDKVVSTNKLTDAEAAVATVVVSQVIQGLSG